MISSEQLLENAALDGSIDVAEWARVLEFLLDRLHEIVFNEFPIPALPIPRTLPSTIDPEVVASTPPRNPTSETDNTEQELPDAENEPPANSQSSTKENDAPRELAAGRPPSGHHPGYPGYEISQSQQTEEMGPLAMPEPGTLPPELLSSYQMSRRILEHDFVHSPPYTIQRLAELVLHPRKHYRFLPAYLRALDRIISVSSPVSDFPLPALHNSLNGGFLTNGEAQTNGISEREGLGSDESLGGALLTPIPWLRNQNSMAGQSTGSQGAEGELHSESTETIEGPHGAGSIETVTVTVNGIPSATAGQQQQQTQQTSSSPIASPTLSEQSDASTSSASSTEAQLRDQGGVTQGELLRQEQEAGVVPVNPSGNHTTPRRTLLQGGAAAVGRDAPGPAAAQGAPDIAIEEEQPHARGPDVIGMEDMGPQPHPIDSSGGVLDMEAAVGRGRSKSPQPPPADGDEMPFEKSESQEMKDAEIGEPGKPGQDPQDVEKEVEKLREAMNREKEAEAKDADGDVIVADADGEPVGAEEKKEAPGDPEPDAVDTTAL
ncbi:hypothetical protein AC579_118 [Lecanosticta acicola]|uniref:Protein phosphatase 4 core regulatory subunit R2 n=1 Tax=Lecanosticta acicola TaxID=111012 RepID=A0AAI8W0I4_9PEZI|nr:hypothetical protein AC579_118 [Lecanosticta acicola]